MKQAAIIYLLIGFLTITGVSSFGQNPDFTMYRTPVPQKWFSKALNDTVYGEIMEPFQLNNSKNIDYPIVYLLDQQNNINYEYNLHTIDYLTSFGVMPECIIVGIALNPAQRNTWTSTSPRNGKANEFITFFTTELQQKLSENYPVGPFHLLIGHSRTAIFSSYALSYRPDFFNGAIARSSSDFDFGDTLHLAQFEQFLERLPALDMPRFLFFSGGSVNYGDMHRPNTDRLADWLESHTLPAQLKWEYYTVPAGHSAVPGLTVGRALGEIFKPYQDALAACFSLLEDSTRAASVTFDDFQTECAQAGKALGFPLQPDLMFFNSLTSTYQGDYQGYFGDNNVSLALELLNNATEYYPANFDLWSWKGELFAEIGDSKNAALAFKKAIELVNSNKDYDEASKQEILQEIRNIQSAGK